MRALQPFTFLVQFLLIVIIGILILEFIKRIITILLPVVKRITHHYITNNDNKTKDLQSHQKESPALIIEKILQCTMCKHLQQNGVCVIIHENVKIYPNRYQLKCFGKHFEPCPTSKK
jgi:hypothetical protein